MVSERAFQQRARQSHTHEAKEIFVSASVSAFFTFHDPGFLQLDEFPSDSVNDRVATFHSRDPFIWLNGNVKQHYEPIRAYSRTTR